MDFDALRAAVVPGSGVVGRWPGLICVAECEDRAVLRRLLDVCASTAGPDPGRTVARRLAMWLGGPDAPGSGLRFGTVAISGDQWAVFLFGSVGLVVPGSGIELSGAHAATWTDRLLSRQDTPGVLVLEGSTVPADLVDGVHDLRAGVVPGAGAVLAQVRRNSGGDTTEAFAPRRPADPAWPELVEIPSELERPTWNLTDTGPVATSRPAYRRSTEGPAEDSPVWRGVRDVLAGDVLGGDLPGGDALGGDLGDNRSGGGGSLAGRAGSGLGGAGWPTTPRRTGPDHRPGSPSGVRRGRTGRAGASRGGLGSNGSVLRAVGSQDFETPERGGAPEGAGRDESGGGRAEDGGPPGAATGEGEALRSGSGARRPEHETSTRSARDAATPAGPNSSAPAAADRRPGASTEVGNTGLQSSRIADHGGGAAERTGSGRNGSGPISAQVPGPAGNKSAGAAPSVGARPGDPRAGESYPGGPGAGTSGAGASSAVAPGAGTLAAAGSDARSGRVDSGRVDSGRAGSERAGRGRAAPGGGGPGGTDPDRAASNGAGVDRSGANRLGLHGGGANRAWSNGAGSNGAGSNGAGSNGAGSNGAGSNGAGVNGAGVSRTASNGAASTGADGAGSIGATMSLPAGGPVSGRAERRGGDTGRPGSGGAAPAVSSARTGSGSAVSRGAEGERAAPDRSDQSSRGVAAGEPGRGFSDRTGSAGTGRADVHHSATTGSSSTADPDRADPGRLDLGRLDPNSAKPGSAESESAEPGSAESESAEPGSAESESAEPGSTEPGGAESESTEPGSAEPGSAESESAEPGGAESESAESESAEPGSSGGEPDADGAASGEAQPRGVAVVSRLVPRAQDDSADATDETGMGTVHPLADVPRRRTTAGAAKAAPPPESDQWFAATTEVAVEAPSRQGRPRHGRPEEENATTPELDGRATAEEAPADSAGVSETQTQLRAERVLGVVQPEPAPQQEAEPATVGVPAAESATTAVPSSSAEAVKGPGEPQQVRGHLCPRGHLNDPRAQFCLSCGAGVEDRGGELVSGPRPALGMLIFDDGATHTVDTDHLVGRMPEADPRVRAGSLRPLLIEDPSGAVSRVHAEIRLNGWDVLLVDSGSRNGTFVAGPGESAWTRLPERQSRWLVPGTRVRLGGRTFLFEAPPGVR